MILNQYHVSFEKWPRSLHILFDFNFSPAILTKAHNQRTQSSGSHTGPNAASKLIVSYLEAFLGYVPSVPKLVTTTCGSTPLAPADPVCRAKPHIAGESPSNTVNWSSQMKNLQVSTSPTHCWKSFFAWAECLTCVQWDGVPISLFASSAFRSQQICNSWVEISCRCVLSSSTTFMYVSLATRGKYAQYWLMHTAGGMHLTLVLWFQYWQVSF